MDKGTDTDDIPRSAKRPLWQRIARVIAFITSGVAVLLALILCLIVWIFTPQKLTPIVERYASGYLDADVTAGRIELTVWSTFPHVRLDVDSLTIVSHTLRALPDSARCGLPAWADTLLQVERLSGGINLAGLAVGTIELHDVEIVRPAINLVQATPTIANYTIVPVSEAEETESGTIPDITINHFAISGDAPIRYLSLPDSTDVVLTIASTGLTDSNGAAPYTVSLRAMTTLASGERIMLDDFTIGVDGRVHWTPREPESLSLTDFRIDLDSIVTDLDVSLSMADPLTINSASVTIAPARIEKLLGYMPVELKDELKGFSTDLTVGASLTLTRPYIPSQNVLPSAYITLTMPDGSLSYQGYSLRRLGADIVMTVNGTCPDSSTVEIRRFEAEGPVTSMHLDGSVTTPLSDPLIDGNFRGNVNLGGLPYAVTRHFPFKLSGYLSGRTGFRLHRSDMHRNRFHRARLSGNLSLCKFRITDTDSMDMYVGQADLSFGTRDRFSTAAGGIDSLLTVSLKIDTASMTMPDMQLIVARATAGIGCRNTASSSDTTLINPIGSKISIGRVDYRSLSDSIRMRLRDIECGAVLRRFQGEGRVPQLGLKASARRISYGDGLTRMSVRDGEFAVTAHMNPRRKLPPRLQARYDSIASANPDATHDSIVSMMRRHRLINLQKEGDTEILDLTVGSNVSRLLRRWNVQGHLQAHNGRMVTPYFPLRNRISDLDMIFTTDSISLNSLTLQSGGSSMNMSGYISNLRRALTSRMGSPLKIRFNIDSDTLNINEITHAAFAGAAFGENADSLRKSIAADANDDELQQHLENAKPTDSIGALLIPTNIDAELTLNAQNILYSDLLFNQLHGSILVYNGGINLNGLSAKTEMGSIDLTALYSARTKNDISFGFGMGVHDFNIERFTHLMPVVDSLLPLMRDFKGIINAEVAATTDVDSTMNIKLPTLNAAIKLTGDSLVVLDRETFRTLSKWLMFKDKKHNMINHMAVELTINNSQLEFYPFIFDMDRYRLGVMGHNDLALNLNYHISVLKSPLPFKFGINVTGTADNMRIRLGRARFKEDMVSERTTIVEDTRINLLKEIESVFRRGVNAARLGPLHVKHPGTLASPDMQTDTISHADSLIFAKEGLIDMPADTITPAPADNKKKKKKK